MTKGKIQTLAMNSKMRIYAGKGLTASSDRAGVAPCPYFL